MERTNINPEIFQDMLESASNAGAKGQAQFYTPPEWAAVLALPLPRQRSAIVDLNCGAGHLLRGAGNKTTETLLGADIDPVAAAPPKLDGPCPLAKLNRVTADATLFYPMLREISWRADLWVLNPPWDLHFWRSKDRLGCLAESELSAVREAFSAHDGRVPERTIDSTVAMLLVALDLCTDAGEGLLIANNATLDRLLFAPNAPHRAVLKHIWARLVIDGNPMTAIQGASYQRDGFKTGVLYFAREPQLPPPCQVSASAQGLAEASAVCQSLANQRDRLRRGARIVDSWQRNTDTVPLWRAAAEEWKARQQPGRTDFNLSLTVDGLIRANLNLFEQSSSRVLKAEAAKLYELHGKRPMELVLQRSQRETLLRMCNLPWGQESAAQPASVWRVDPKLQEAVREAVREYHGCRAPLYPLPGLQRLGYLEEEDSILCWEDLWDREHVTPLFCQGKRYSLATQSVQVVRTGAKPNLAGEMERVEYSGSELATYITDETGTERCFMEGRLRDENVTVNGYPADQKIDFTLQELDQHFVIPDVPDVAALDPDGFRRNLSLIDELEALINDI